MTENEALKIAIHCLGVQAEQEACEECPVYRESGIVCKETARTAIKTIKEIQQYRKIGTVEEIRKIIKQGIDNCYMAHKYEQPGYEEGMCAGLRTMNGDGEPAYKCQLCRLYYLSDSERSDNHDGE